MSMAATIFADETQISAMTVAGRAGPKKMSGLRSINLVARGPSTVWRRSSRLLLPTRRTLARSWSALPLSVRAVLLMVTGSLLFSVMGALVKLLGQQIDSFQIAFFRCFFGFIAILPFVLLKRGRHAFRTTYFYGHFLRGALGVAAIVAGFYATTRLPLTDSTAISFTAPLFMILTAIFLLGEKVRWRRGLATAAGFIGVLVMVRPDGGTLDLGAVLG
jgi:drug/metabolite transporter (DMT)-like permease